MLRTALEMKEGNLRHECITSKYHNIKNKQHLFCLLVAYLCADDSVTAKSMFKNENEQFKISFECNDEEANTRMIFHALQQKTNVVVCSKDTGVLVSMAFVYTLHEINEK